MTKHLLCMAQGLGRLEGVKSIRRNKHGPFVITITYRSKYRDNYCTPTVFGSNSNPQADRMDEENVDDVEM